MSKRNWLRTAVTATAGLAIGGNRSRTFYYLLGGYQKTVVC